MESIEAGNTLSTNLWIVNAVVPLAAALMGASVGALVSWVVHSRDIKQQRQSEFRVSVSRLLEAAIQAQTPTYVDTGMKFFAPVRDYGPGARALRMRAFAAMTAAPEDAPKGLKDGLEWVAGMAEDLSRNEMTGMARIAFLEQLPVALKDASPQAVTEGLLEAKKAIHGKNDDAEGAS